jgi:hypothetical protein
LLEFAGCSDLKELDLERLIGSRNPIAHGSRPTEDVELAALESLVRTLLNHGIAWSLVSQELESFTGRELLDRLAGWEHAGQKPLCSLVDQIPAGHPGQKAAQKIDSEQELEYELSQAARAFDSAIELVEKVFVPKKYGKKLERNIQEKFGNPVGSRHFSDSYHLAEDGTRVRLREERIGSVPDYHSAAEKLRQAHSFIRQRRWVKAGKLAGECVAVMNEAAVLHQSEAHVWAQAEILFLAHRQRAEIFTEKKQNLDALQELEAAQQAFQKLLLQDAGDRAIQFSNFLCRYSLALSKESRFDDAVAKAQEAAGIIEKAPDPNATETRSARVGVLNCLAIRQNEAGLLNDALQTARESFALARELYVGDRSFRQDYYMALHTLSRRYERLGNHEKARFFREEARRKELRYVTDD